MEDSKEFAVGVFDALIRRRRQKAAKITKIELHDFWLQISDQSFDARLQIFFDMWVSLFLFVHFVRKHALLLISILNTEKQLFFVLYLK